MAKSTKKLRPAGKVLLDIEPLLFELVRDHELQLGEILNLIHCWALIHYPDCQETYSIDKSHPIFYYGYNKENK